jgi:hypothetical protein
MKQVRRYFGGQRRREAADGHVGILRPVAEIANISFTGWEYAHFLQVYEASILTAMGKNRCCEPSDFFGSAHCFRNFIPLSMERSVMHQIQVRFQPNCCSEGAKD